MGGDKDYDICIRTDKHGQSIYGPSVTPLESSGQDGAQRVYLVALGGSKAMHEFLVLHYMATRQCCGMGCVLGQLPAPVHLGTCWSSEGTCVAHV